MYAWGSPCYDLGQTLRMVILLMCVMLGMRVGAQSVVSTAQGELRGTGHDGYVSYRGVPYATMADVDGRFKEARPAPFWTGIRDSKESYCSIVSSVEDCLQLDVHVPSDGSSSWPVLVWVTGSSAEYNPRHIVQTGIIVVVVHHRIGPLGFLCVGNERIPGNAAVKDVVLALRWVQDNIVAFKGNPSKVVLAGQSLGAAIVEGITISSMAKDLYHGVIMESGTILAPWAFNYDAKERAMMLGEMLSEEDIYTSALMRARTEELVDNGYKMNRPYIPFGMCIDNPLKDEERVFWEAPVDMLTSKKISSVPMIIGYNSDEAYIFTSMLKDVEVSRDELSLLLPQELKFLNDREIQQATRQVEDMYFKSNMSIDSMLAYHRDAYFVNHIHRSVRLHSSAHPVYYYQFSYSSDIGIQEEPGVRKTGAAHSDELAYLFSGADLQGNDGVVQRNLITLWTNFVKYQDPNKDSVTWETVDVDHPRLLDIGTEMRMVDYPLARTAHMWDDLFNKYYYSRNRHGA